MGHKIFGRRLGIDFLTCNRWEDEYTHIWVSGFSSSYLAFLCHGLNTNNNHSCILNFHKIVLLYDHLTLRNHIVWEEHVTKIILNILLRCYSLLRKEWLSDEPKERLLERLIWSACHHVTMFSSRQCIPKTYLETLSLLNRFILPLPSSSSRLLYESFFSPLADGTCAGVRCHPDATCDQDQPLGPVCLCKAGYQGNGRKCSGKDLWPTNFTYSSSFLEKQKPCIAIDLLFCIIF